MFGGVNVEVRRESPLSGASVESPRNALPDLPHGIGGRVNADFGQGKRQFRFKVLDGGPHPVAEIQPGAGSRFARWS